MKRAMVKVSTETAHRGELIDAIAVMALRGLVNSELLDHLSALRKCIERARAIDDRSSDSGSSWQSAEYEATIENADKALKFICDLFGVPSEVQ